eukprot:GHUV01013854.1.p1 GENE.GHUV01013854.1~~GHUV01013854.1.p1  ORF type:complete len:436 (+),score=91.66 GHUV01013854.1:437-1744(+)
MAVCYQYCNLNALLCQYVGGLWHPDHYMPCFTKVLAVIHFDRAHLIYMNTNTGGSIAASYKRFLCVYVYPCQAIMLAGLAMKKNWQKRRQAAGLPTDKPNIVMSYSVQVCWEKFCRYWDVEEKYVPLEEGRYSITAELAREQIDENTIGVVGILGSTYNGEFEDIEALDEMVEEVNQEKGWSVPIHVDAASGGFIAPFIYPELVWDFRLKNVKSINVSGHKYGLVFAGIGWVLWREPQDVPEDLVFHLNYLGSDQASITLNFSRGASNVLGQYYQLLRLGRTGYSRIMSNLDTIAKRLADGIMETGEFDLLSKDQGVPLVAFRLKKKVDKHGKEVERSYDEYDVSDRLKEHGWVLPAYTMAPDAKHVKLLRAVIRVDHSMTMIEKLIAHIHEAMQVLKLQESAHLKKVRQLVREKMQPHRAPDNPYRQVKTTGQC